MRWTKPEAELVAITMEVTADGATLLASDVPPRARESGPSALFQVRVILLGTAAGGGFPQWNCWCPTCRAARSDPRSALPRSQSSVAISSDGTHWFLLNASPDVRDQVQQLNGHAPDGYRHVPIEGVVLTDAELDHSLGLVLLREGRALRVYATEAVERMITEDSRLLSVVAVSLK